MVKKPLSFKQMFNLNFGFLGIQFGWGLQMANMSAIYKFLGADAGHIGYLWLAAPLSGLIIQPILGHLSDNTWTRIGRRRPYILAGAILSTFALLLMPNSNSLFMAACLLWVLDGSVNIAMQPYRALVADVAPCSQQTKCFAIQTVLIGIGGTLASALPWIFLHVFHVSDAANGANIPLTIRLSFYLGASVFILANLWTTFSSKEYPPKNLEEWHKNKQEKSILDKIKGLSHIFSDLAKMPTVMRQISFVQFFTWLGLFCMFLYYSLAVSQTIFGLPAGAMVKGNPHYQLLMEHGVAVGGMCFALYTLYSFIFAYFIPFFSRLITRKYTLLIALLLGGFGLISTGFIHTPIYLYTISMLGIGIAWACISTIPYAMLGSSLPEDKMGVYMGLFNMTICIPEIIAALVLGGIVSGIFHDNAIAIITLGGIFFVIGAFLTIFVKDEEVCQAQILPPCIEPEV